MKLKYAPAVAAVCCAASVSVPARADDNDIKPDVQIKADVQIHAEYVAVYDRIRPDPFKDIHLRHSFDVTLSGQGTVSESETLAAGTSAGRRSARTILGQGNSGAGSMNWTVLGPDKLQRDIEGPQHVMTMTIVVTGTNCTLEVNFKLKPGFKEFKMKQLRNGQPGFFTQPKVTETKCSIK